MCRTLCFQRYHPPPCVSCRSAGKVRPQCQTGKDSPELRSSERTCRSGTDRARSPHSRARHVACDGPNWFQKWPEPLTSPEATPVTRPAASTLATVGGSTLQAGATARRVPSLVSREAVKVIVTPTFTLVVSVVMERLTTCADEGAVDEPQAETSSVVVATSTTKAVSSGSLVDIILAVCTPARASFDCSLLQRSDLQSKSRAGALDCDCDRGAGRPRNGECGQKSGHSMSDPVPQRPTSDRARARGREHGRSGLVVQTRGGGERRGDNPCRHAAAEIRKARRSLSRGDHGTACALVPDSFESSQTRARVCNQAVEEFVDRRGSR